MRNENFKEAKTARFDEFFTPIEEIQTELENYSDKFQGKVVFCNCDDPFHSDFVKYFLMNFNRLGLKELIAAGFPIYNTEDHGYHIPCAFRITNTKNYLSDKQTDLDSNGVNHFLSTDGKNFCYPLSGNFAKGDDGEIIQTKEVKIVIDSDGKRERKITKRPVYYEAGDFRSEMSIELLQQADILVSNPPFSHFIAYIEQIISNNKQFLVLGSMNAITYKNFFPLLKKNSVWLGCTTGQKLYRVPEAYARENPSSVFFKNGQWMTKMGNTTWFTNLDHAKRHKILPLNLNCVYKGNEDQYPCYDNYNAINVNKVNQIPSDYMGIMGVPISFLEKYCPEQFKIIGGSIYDDTPCRIERNYKKLGFQFFKPDGKSISKSGALKDRTTPKVKAKGKGDFSVGPNGEILSACYARIFIRRNNN